MDKKWTAPNKAITNKDNYPPLPEPDREGPTRALPMTSQRHSRERSNGPTGRGLTGASSRENQRRPGLHPRRNKKPIKPPRRN